MATRSRYDLIDRLLDGRLAEVLAGWKAEGVSFDEQARRMEDDHGIAITRETLRRWSNANTATDLGKVG